MKDYKSHQYSKNDGAYYAHDNERIIDDYISHSINGTMVKIAWRVSFIVFAVCSAVDKIFYPAAFAITLSSLVFLVISCILEARVYNEFMLI